MPAPLANFLKAIHAGGASNTGFSQELYDAYGGDDILTSIQAYDPNARWEDVDMGGGEGGSNQRGKKLVYDVTKLPASAAGNAALDLRAEDHKESDRLLNKDAVIEDETYGRVTNAKNFADDKSEAWEKIAPLAIAVLAPMAGAAMAAGGIGLAGAGATSAVTGGAAGLSAANIPGAAAAAAAGGTAATKMPAWMSKILTKAPQLARSADQGGWQSLLGGLAGAAGVPLSSMIPAVLKLLAAKR